MSGPAEAEVSEILSQMQQDEQQQDELQSRDTHKNKKDKGSRLTAGQIEGPWSGNLASTSQIDPSILPPMPTASSIMTSYNNPIAYQHQYGTASNDIRKALAAASSNRSGASSRRNQHTTDRNSGNIAVEQPRFQSNPAQNTFPDLQRASGQDAGSAFDHVDAPDNYLGEGTSKNGSYSLGGGLPDSQYFESLLQSGFSNHNSGNINIDSRISREDALDDDDDDAADEMPLDLDSSYEDALDNAVAAPAQMGARSGRGTGKPRGRRPKIPYTGAMPRDSVEYVKLKKENHKNVEKKRRETINEGIKLLADQLPKPDKNKSKIIMQAVDYIEDLRKEKDSYIDKWTTEKLVQDRLYKQVLQERDHLQQTLALKEVQIEDLKRLLSDLASSR